MDEASPQEIWARNEAQSRTNQSLKYEIIVLRSPTFQGKKYGGLRMVRETHTEGICCSRHPYPQNKDMARVGRPKL